MKNTTTIWLSLALALGSLPSQAGQMALFIDLNIAAELPVLRTVINNQ
jgi:hypothetical protein